MPEERLQKILAQAGVASRRKAEELIRAGRVSVDGKIVTELGTRADPRRARVELDGRRLVAERLVYLVLNKPRGVMCTMHDPEGRPSVAELVTGTGVRVVPVGRLDFHTSGALLFSNDGEFSSTLQHPKHRVAKLYVAKVQGRVEDADLPRFARSIEIEGRATQPAEVRRLRFEGDKTWLEVTLREGRNRQVRRLGEEAGFPIMRLSRITHAGISAEGLRPGQWRYLSVDELKELKRNYGVPQRVRAPEPMPANTSARRPPRGRSKIASETRRPAGRAFDTPDDGRGFAPDDRRGGPRPERPGRSEAKRASFRADERRGASKAEDTRTRSRPEGKRSATPQAGAGSAARGRRDRAAPQGKRAPAKSRPRKPR